MDYSESYTEGKDPDINGESSEMELISNASLAPWTSQYTDLAVGSCNIDNRGIGIGNLSRDTAPCVLRFWSSLPIVSGACVVDSDQCVRTCFGSLQEDQMEQEI